MRQPSKALGVIGFNSRFVWRVLQCLSMERQHAYVFAHTARRDERVFHRSRYCLGTTDLDLDELAQEPARAANILGELCRKSGVDFLIPADLPSAALLAKIRGQIPGVQSYPLPAPDLLQQMSHKLEFARLLDRLRLPQPAFIEIHPGQPVPKLAFDYPAMVKPPTWDAGRGIKLCHGPQQVAEHLRSLNLSEPAQIQQFVPGYDLDLTLLATEGRITAWAIHKRSSQKDGAMFPSCVFVEHDPLLQIGRRLVRETGFTGLAHIDGRVDARDGKVLLIECNPRVYDSIHFAAFAGVNFIAAGLDLCKRDESARSWTQRNGVVNTPLGALKLLFKPIAGIPIWTPGTRQAWRQLLRDPAPWALTLSRRRHRPISPHP